MKPIALFIAKCLTVCAGTMLLLLLLNYRYEQVMDHPYADADKFKYMKTIYTDIQVCNIGSSHGEYAFYYEELTKSEGFECFNFAMSSQTYDYDYAILSMYRENFSENCLMFIPVSYFSFNNEVTNEEEAQFLNAKYYTFLSPRYIPGYDPYVDIVTHYLPILSAGENIIKLLPRLSLRAFAAQPQTSADGPSIEKFREKAASRYHRHMDGKEEYFLDERINNLKDILTFCKKNSITPVLITTPYTGLYSSLFPDSFKAEFHNTVNDIAGEFQVPYYDYSEDTRFSDSLTLFSDADHLNKEGAALFTNIIREEIPEFREFLLHTTPNHVGDDPSWVNPY